MEEQMSLLRGYTVKKQAAFRKRGLQLIGALKQRVTVKLKMPLDGFNRDGLLAVLESGLGKPCCYCGERITIKSMSLDHVMPISRGGNPWDVQCCCLRCNREKGELTDEEYRRFLAHIKTYSPEAQQYIHRMMRAGGSFFRMQRVQFAMRKAKQQYAPQGAQPNDSLSAGNE